ncbi:MAG: HAD-IA family hydrolase [Candidatus Nanoarchaeia archaeon]|jgi:putative hydrolase of the HAD superfamily
MIKALLFDLDNTLLDFVKMKITCSKASVKAMIKAGLKMTEKDAYTKLMSIYAKTSYEDPVIFENFLKEFNKKIDYKILSAAIVAYRRVVNDLLIPYEGVTETLKILKRKGLILGIVTDAPRLKAWIRLTTAGLSNYFNLIITLGDSKRRKPHKIPFQKALRELKLKPEEVLFIGDNPEKDIAGANKIGMKTVLAKYGSFIKSKSINKDEKPTYIINKFNELLRLI